MSTDDPPVKASRIHDLARQAATRDLREMYPAQWQLLMEGWLEHYRQELGWYDQRAEANRARVRP